MTMPQKLSRRHLRWILIALYLLGAALVYLALEYPTAGALLQAVSTLLLLTLGIGALAASASMTADLVIEGKDKGTVAQLLLGLAAVFLAVALR